MRSFFLHYPQLLEKQHAVRVVFDTRTTPGASQVRAGLNDDWHPGELHPGLSWTHYRTLLKVERRPVRDFCEIEAVRNGWSA